MNTLLQAESVSVRVGETNLLADVALELRAGELAVLLGANGAGKSTLLRVLLGELPPCSGSVRLLGKRLESYDAMTRARAITLVPQDQPADFPLRVRELVELGRLPHDDQRSLAADTRAVQRALELTGLTALAERVVPSLSGGERQRTSLARALAQATPVILLDEPTAHLDIAHQLSVLEVVRDVTRAGGAALVALHDLGLASRFADRLFVLERGQLVASGPPARVLTSALLERSFGVHGAIEHDPSGRIRHLTVLGTVAGGAPC